MTKRIAIGMAGAGWPAWQQIKGFKRLEDVEVRALCDIDEERLDRIAGEYGIPNRYASYEEMLKKETLDAVSVCTPNFLHGTMSVKALGLGAARFVRKAHGRHQPGPRKRCSMQAERAEKCS